MNKIKYLMPNRKRSTSNIRRPTPNEVGQVSREDFVHKLRVCLKELRETRRWARLIQRKGWAMDDPTLVFVLSESDESIRIFFSSIQTAQSNAAVGKNQQPGPARYSSH